MVFKLFAAGVGGLPVAGRLPSTVISASPSCSVAVSLISSTGGFFFGWKVGTSSHLADVPRSALPVSISLVNTLARLSFCRLLSLLSLSFAFLTSW